MEQDNVKQNAFRVIIKILPQTLVISAHLLANLVFLAHLIVPVADLTHFRRSYRIIHVQFPPIQNPVKQIKLLHQQDAATQLAMSVEILQITVQNA